jgi:hypothetical protein
MIKSLDKFQEEGITAYILQAGNCYMFCYELPGRKSRVYLSNHGFIIAELVKQFKGNANGQNCTFN